MFAALVKTSDKRDQCVTSRGILRDRVRPVELTASVLSQAYVVVVVDVMFPCSVQLANTRR
jgi:hypothetical protein